MVNFGYFLIFSRNYFNLLYKFETWCLFQPNTVNEVFGWNRNRYSSMVPIPAKHPVCCGDIIWSNFSFVLKKISGPSFVLYLECSACASVCSENDIFEKKGCQTCCLEIIRVMSISGPSMLRNILGPDIDLGLGVSLPYKS